MKRARELLVRRHHVERTTTVKKFWSTSAAMAILLGAALAVALQVNQQKLPEPYAERQQPPAGDPAARRRSVEPAAGFSD